MADGETGEAGGAAGARPPAGSGAKETEDRGPANPAPAGSPGPRNPASPREFRMADLAHEAGVTVRTLRFYRERGLLPAPRREGRIAWYNEHHLARLRTVSALLERGHTLSGIAELLTAFERGHDVGEVLGLKDALVTPWSQETPVHLTPEELADHFKDDVTAENLAASLDIGYLAVDGDAFVHVSRHLLDASTELVRRGVPLAAVLEAGRAVRSHADALADLFTTVIRTHILQPLADSCDEGRPSPDTVAELTDTVERLRPTAQAILDAEISMAMDRRIRAEVDTWLRGRGTRRPESDGAGAGDPAEGGGGAGGAVWRPKLASEVPADPGPAPDQGEGRLSGPRSRP